MKLDYRKLEKLNINSNYVNSFLHKIDSNISDKFVKKINNENNRDNIISILTELKFVNLFLDLNCSIINYEKPYVIDDRKQTPDLTICYRDCLIIAEVYRLGKSNIDSLKQDFIDSISDKLEGISSYFAIEFEINFQKFNYNTFDFNELAKSVNSWLLTKPDLGDHLNFNDFVSLQIKFTHKKNKTYGFSTPVFLTIKNDKLFQIENYKDNEITKKIRKYRALIKTLNTPFFLLIETDLVSGFHHSDFKERFHSTQTEVYDYEKFQNYWTNQRLGKIWTKLGDFYKQEYHFLSGLIILCDNEYRLLLSPLKNQTIYKREYSVLLKKLKENFIEI